MPVDEVRRQLERAVAELGGEGVEARLERPRNPDHGDLATAVALELARRTGVPPRKLAEALVQRLDLGAAGIAGVEIAGPGFINFRLAHHVLQERLLNIVRSDTRYGRAEAKPPQRIQVEFVSANPTGPLHVAHGRGAALGDAIARLLEWSGHHVFREFYVNDAGVQVSKLGESLDVRWRELAGETVDLPVGGYQGEYVKELAVELGSRRDVDLRLLPEGKRRQQLEQWAVERLLMEQDRDLREFGVEFDLFYRETRLYEEGKIKETLRELQGRGLAYEADGAVWLRTTDFGDDKDRVLVKTDGTFTYFLPDIAYHREKLRRGFDLVIDVWGADHHGYVPRMRAALAALGAPDLLEVHIVQMVRIMRGEREVRLSKRAGEFVTLRELIDETGPDVARYFFLMRRGDAQMVFDLDLALDDSEKNPVFKVQYAHARLASIFRKAGVTPEELAPESADLALLVESVEQELIRQLGEFPQAMGRAAAARAPHLVCEYLETTAGMVNSWYHEGHPSRNPGLTVLAADERLRLARLVLARAVQVVLRNGLLLLGLSAPERMDREGDA